MRTPPNKSFFKEHPFVAMKRITDDPNPDTNKEVEILMKLQHKNIVKYFNAFMDDSTNDLFIIMEYCDRNLEDGIKEMGINTDERNVGMTICQLASALSHVHQKGIIHRDIKPANILCKNTEKDTIILKLADFGLAKVMNKTPSGRNYAGTYCGTPIYMSPEVLKEKRYGTPTDIWSFGAVISFVCNGGKDLFTNEKDVLKWRGGKSTLDEKEYSIYLQKIVTNMLSPEEDSRLKAYEIWKKTTNLIDVLDRIPS